MEQEAIMNEELELALAYWRTMAPQPKAIVYANAIEAQLQGIETKVMVVDHELTNAITRGASIARSRGLIVSLVQFEEKVEVKSDATTRVDGRKAKHKRKGLT
jgi:hypothetical protein